MQLLEINPIGTEMCEVVVDTPKGLRSRVFKMPHKEFTAKLAHLYETRGKIRKEFPTFTYDDYCFITTGIVSKEQPPRRG